MRGIDNEPVTPKSLVKSINSCKSFEPTSEVSNVSKWLAVLAAELAERMAEDEADHARRARTLGEQQAADAGPGRAWPEGQPVSVLNHLLVSW